MTPAPPRQEKFPSGFVLVLLVFAFIIGGWRVLVGGGQLLFSALQTKESALAQATASRGLFGAKKDLDEKTQEMAAQMVEVQWRYRPAVLGLGVVELPLSLLLLLGAWGTWRRDESKRRLLRAVCLAKVPLQLATTTVAAMVSLAVMRVLGDFSSKMMGSAVKDPQAAEVLGGVMKGAAAMGMLFSFTLAVVICGFFVALWWQLGKPEVRAHFTPAAPQATP
ncbi:MAG: hypothetical protein AB1938_04900 [Myxococcota bacterium]